MSAAPNLQEMLDAFADQVAARVVARMQPAPAQPSKDDWLTPKEAAELLKCSWQRLETLRRTRGGPPFVKEGKRLIRYSRVDVLAHLAANPKRRNTIKDA